MAHFVFNRFIYNAYFTTWTAIVFNFSYLTHSVTARILYRIQNVKNRFFTVRLFYKLSVSYEKVKYVPSKLTAVILNIVIFFLQLVKLYYLIK